MKKILIAIDYDPTAKIVADSGFELAKSMNAEVILLHVVADYTYYSSLDYSPVLGFDSFSNLGAIQANTVIELQNAAKDYLSKIKNHLGDKSIQTIVKEGDTADAVLDAAKESGVDIIVMGTHGRRGLDKILMGSVAQKVLKNSKVPMFIIPSKENNAKGAE
ncbi:MAG TPA: universal stress protein [Hanamia sp.]|nr:universal stress protein [Hanamia sp.]